MREQFDPECWRRWKDLFDQAADLDAARQAELLDSHCQGDPDLRERFAAMLAAHQQSAALLDRSLPERLVTLAAEAGLEAPQAPPPLPAGTLLKERYRTEEVIGSGGWSVVYLARDEQMQGRNVVVKVLLREGTEHSVIDDEIAAMSHLHHPGIAAPLDSGMLPDGRRFLVLAYIPGITLRADLLRNGAMGAGRVVRFLRAMGSALETAHGEGVCHLDLKPENILLQRNRDREDPIIVDFGISRLLQSPGTATSLAAGSLSYMAPEQLNGEPVAASDQYSLALIAAEMLTGRRPSPLGSASEILQACEGLPPHARHALERALSASPAQRYPSIDDFVTSLTAALDPESRRYRRLGFSAGAAIAILLIAGGLGYWLDRRQEEQMIASDMKVISAQMATWVRMADSSPFPAGALNEAFGAPLARLQRMVAEGHREPDVLMTLSNSLALYGTYLGHPGRRNVGESEKGIAALRQSLDVAEILRGVTPDQEWWRIFSADRHDMLASVLVEAGEYEQAEQVVRKGLALLENFPEHAANRRGAMSIRGGLLMTLSRIYFHRKEFEECLRLRDQAVEIRRQVLPMYDNVRLARYDVAGYLATRGYLLRDMGRLDEAYRDYAESEKIVEQLLEEESWNLQFRWLHARNEMETGRLFLLRKQPGIAREHLEEGAKLMHGMLDDSRHEITSLRSYALCLSWLATARFRQGGKLSTVRPLVAEALQTNQAALDQDPMSAKTRDERDLIFQNAREAGIRPGLTPEIPLH